MKPSPEITRLWRLERRRARLRLLMPAVRFAAQVAAAVLIVEWLRGGRP